MDKSPAVLLCGNDEETLVLRSKVLELAGIPVTKTRSEADALRLLAGGDVRVVVLCHSLREAQRTVMLKAAGAAEPRARAVVLCVPDIELSGRIDVVLTAMDGPAKLVAAVRRLEAEGAETKD